MSKSKDLKIPKKLFGFKLSKGTRKDLKKLGRMFSHPDKRALAMAAAGGLASFLAERFADRAPRRPSDPGKAH
jgi:hypothetical protein